MKEGENVDWGKILLDSGIIAMISIAGAIVTTLLANVITDIKGYKNINRKIGDVFNTTLSGQHQGIERAITGGNEQLNKVLEKSAESLLSKVETTSNGILGQVHRINEKIVQEATAQQYSHENLSESQKELKNHINAIESLAKEWEALVTENKGLKTALHQARQEIQALNYKIQSMEQEISQELE
ncbi:hypothetical protein [Desulfosporosinus nitroreducens]|uniref:Uncharacterized protein n=1 Tax=Desulfosporosinus nitroreducens TaxID=2018668 RepID=A0ABT8QU35_9FIRM|nr:hypothetical protein [Desulfosporosinus nitroreducens]MDO0824069.1 hypothetical protein [Desulfosporosinus nitroreducens]